jgi:hypothetical protein
MRDHVGGNPHTWGQRRGVLSILGLASFFGCRVPVGALVSLHLSLADPLPLSLSLSLSQ